MKRLIIRLSLAGLMLLASIATVSTALGNTEVDLNNDFGADSLDTVELIVEVEDAFDLAIPEN